jgi:two-component system, LytTR family, response regulator
MEGENRIAMSMRAVIDHERMEQGPVEVIREIHDVQSTLGVRCGGRSISIDLAAIEWIEAAANYVKIHAGGNQYTVRQKISTLEQQLPPSKFVRIHRCLIVGMNHMRELQSCGNGEFVVVLRNAKELPLGRTYRTHVEGALRQGKPTAS